MTAATNPTHQATTRDRAWNVTLWVLQVVTAAWILLAALGKFAGTEQIVAIFEAIGFGVWFRYLIGALEVAGAAALFIPRLAGLAGLAVAGLMIGAAATQLFVLGAGLALPLVLFAFSALIAWGRRRGIAQLWAAVARQ